LGSDPLNRMSFTLSVTLQLHSNTRVGRLEAGFDQPDRHFEKSLTVKGFWPDW
jgi:hypothetical protein